MVLIHPLPPSTSIFSTIWRFFSYYNYGWLDEWYWHQWVGIRDAAENSTVHRAVSISKNYLAQSVNSANVGKHFNKVCNTSISIILMRKVRQKEAKALSLGYSGSNC